MIRNIGILTFHYTNNHGAVLQAYALREMINSFSNCRAEIINYVPEGFRYTVPFGSNMTEMKRKREKFSRFLSDHCGICMPMCNSVTENIYDTYIVGSDMIWNTDFQEVVANDTYFLPDLDESAKRIAYSASIGIKPERMDKKLFQKYLSKFDAISLREKSYVEIITEMIGRKCENTLDPTLLFDGTHYESFIEKPDAMISSDMSEKPFALCFWYDRGDGCGGGVETVNAIARKYELTIKHTFLSETSVARQMLVRDGGCMLQCGIGEFLWYIKNAAVVITNSFHGAIFSVLFERPLYICYQEPWSCRQKDLVKLLCLEDRVVRGYLSSDRLNLKTDYGPTFHVLESERKHSISYLQDAIGIT